MHPKLVSQVTGVGGSLAPVNQAALDFAEISAARNVFRHLPIALTQRSAPRGEHGGPETLGKGLEFLGQRLVSFLKAATTCSATVLGGDEGMFGK
jgi:hypothetical protein